MEATIHSATKRCTKITSSSNESLVTSPTIQKNTKKNSELLPNCFLLNITSSCSIGATVRLASVGRMVPIAGLPLPALCFLESLARISCDSQFGYCQFSKFKVLSVSQLPGTRQDMFVFLWTYIAFSDVFLNANLSSDFMNLRYSAALCTSWQIRKAVAAKSKKALRSLTLCCSYPDQISLQGGQHRFHGWCVSWALGQHYMPLVSISSLC